MPCLTHLHLQSLPPFTDDLIAAFLPKPLWITLIGPNLLLMLISTDVCYYVPGALVAALCVDCSDRHNRHGQFPHPHHLPRWGADAGEAKSAGEGGHRPRTWQAWAFTPGRSARRCGRGSPESRLVTTLRTTSHTPPAVIWQLVCGIYSRPAGLLLNFGQRDIILIGFSDPWLGRLPFQKQNEEIDTTFQSYTYNLPRTFCFLTMMHLVAFSYCQLLCSELEKQKDLYA